MIEKHDLTQLASLIEEEEFKQYFLGEPGRDHYYLLASFSFLQDNTTLLDIGTYKGCSALALSLNPTNKVISFDIVGGLTRLKAVPSNVEFRIADVISGEYDQLILASPLILLDTEHKGPYEHAFYQHLKAIKYKGKLLLDDIHLNTEMESFWNTIEKPKQDITEHGHYTGTGIVEFE